jgi:hypothetical protein
LREVARHKIVLQLDRSRVPGQVAGDAALCRTICIGGDGAIDRIVFPEFCGDARTTEELGRIALNLLENQTRRENAVAESQQRAERQLSFRALLPQLEAFFARIGNR